MPPVAMFRRAGSLLALLLAALSFSAPSSALATDSAPLMPEASARSGLKLSSPAALAAGRFKFDGEPEATDDEPAADAAPRPIHILSQPTAFRQRKIAAFGAVLRRHLDRLGPDGRQP